MDHHLDRRALLLLHADARRRRDALTARTAQPEIRQHLLDGYRERGIGEDGYPLDFPHDQKKL